MGARKTSDTDVEDIDLDTEESSDNDADFEIELTDDSSNPTDNIGQISVEIDVEELIAELEADSGHKLSSGGGSARKRLEEALEKRRILRELEDLEGLEDLDWTFNE